MTLPNIQKVKIALCVFVGSFFFLCAVRPIAASDYGSLESVLKDNEQKMKQLETKLGLIEKNQSQLLETVNYLKIRLRKVGR